MFFTVYTESVQNKVDWKTFAIIEDFQSDAMQRSSCHAWSRNRYLRLTNRRPRGEGRQAMFKGQSAMLQQQATAPNSLAARSPTDDDIRLC